jgi:hypothetical protein
VRLCSGWCFLFNSRYLIKLRMGAMQGMGLVLDAEGMLGSKRSKRCVCVMHACRQAGVLSFAVHQQLGLQCQAICCTQVLCHR